MGNKQQRSTMMVRIVAYYGVIVQVQNSALVKYSSLQYDEIRQDSRYCATA